VLKEKEQDVQIPGIGPICTQWVGEKGKKQLIQLADQETCRTLQQELHTLANECKKALAVPARRYKFRSTSTEGQLLV